MHATVRRYDGVAASPHDIMRTGQQIARVLGQLPGFVTYLVWEGEDGVLASLTIFETREDREAADRWLASAAGAPFEAGVGRPVELSAGKLIVQRGL